jgi:4-hydroxybenzoate polyprenyltransferase
MIRDYLELVKFAHTLFALPFALAAMLVAAQGLPSGWVLGWILAAMVFARTMAMTFNRLMDLEFDSRNPRTQERPLVTGKVSVRSAWVLWGACSAGLYVSAWMLNPACLALSPVVWGLLNGYSFAKRFTAWTHLWLGLALGLAPLGAWVAVTGQIEWQPIPLGLAVVLWVAGFDIIYSLQDEVVDHRLGLHSLVVRLGPAKALVLSRLFHAGTVLMLYAFGLLLGLGHFYDGGVGLIAAALVIEQSLVSHRDRSHINAAFFTANGFISLILLAAVCLDLFFG